MPNIGAIHPGLRLVSGGRAFEVLGTHPLDSNIWRVHYEDGHDGVFDTQWLLDLANSSEYGTQAGPATEIHDDTIEEGDEESPVTAALTTELTREEMDTAHQQAIENDESFNAAWAEALGYDIEITHFDAILLNREFNIQRGRIQDIEQAHAEILREFMPVWHIAALAEEELRSRPPCPGCNQRYTGTLGGRGSGAHRCAQITAASCTACLQLQTELIGRPQALPIICEACSNNGIIHCRKCSATIQPQAAANISGRICQNCRPRRQFNVWSSVPRAKGNNIVDEIGSQRPFSVEIESFMDPRLSLERRVDAGDFGWSQSGDGSVHADSSLVEWARAQGRTNEIAVVEFKSPPFVGDGGLAMLHADVRKIRRMGFRANSSCGLHVHIDAGGFTQEDKKALHKFGKWTEDSMFKLVAASREDNTYCKRLSTNMSETDRYRWLNMSSIQKHGTVEIRLHHGCTIPTRVSEWAKLCVKFIEAGLKLGRLRSVPTVPTSTLYELLGLSPYETRFWKAISAELHPTPRPTEGGQD